jgi:CheY-like chemotaxis protein
MSADASSPLQFLLVSADKMTPAAAREGLKDIGTIESVPSANEAAEFVQTRRIDGVIVDLDLKSALKLIGEMRHGKNARAFAFVCVNNDAESAVALKGGANALLTKPLSAQLISATVGAFRSIIVSERRRYRRHDVRLPVVVILAEHTYQGIVENISQGGMAVRLPCLLPESSVIDFSFDLDSGPTIEGSAQMKWANREGVAGMVFRKLPARSKSELMQWLARLAARDGHSIPDR